MWSGVCDPEPPLGATCRADVDAPSYASARPELPDPGPLGPAESSRHYSSQPGATTVDIEWARTASVASCLSRAGWPETGGIHASVGRAC